MYQERFYRHHYRAPIKLGISYRESDLIIISDKNIEKNHALNSLISCYHQIDAYAKLKPAFFYSLKPIALDTDASLIIQEMLKAAQISNVGPFAAVAGAVAYQVGRELAVDCDELIIENGGDLFLKTRTVKNISLYLGENFSMEYLDLKVKNFSDTIGICSSSAVIGPSLNFGNADLCTIIADNPVLADALATSYSNKINTPDDAASVIEEARNNSYVKAIVVAVDNKLFLWGDCIEVIK
jgi:hypothetical protein